MPEEKRSSMEIVGEELSKFCFSSEGRGRFQSFNETYRFSYESVMKWKNPYWGFSVHLPLFGEELLHMELAKALEGKVGVSGSFADRVKIGMHGNSEYGNLLGDFYREVGFLLRMAQVVKLKTHDVSCMPKEIGFMHDDYEIGSECTINGDGGAFFWGYRHETFEVGVKLDETRTLTLGGIDAPNGSFRQIVLDLREENQDRYDGSPLKLTLYLSNCL